MTIRIQITGQPVGRTWLYEGLGRTGRKALVPTYRLILAVDEQGVWVPDQYFEVTRDSSEVIFGGLSPHYGINGECPPSRLAVPYRAMWHGHGRLKDAIRLYEEGVSNMPEYEFATVRGTGTERRRGVLIHRGPAMSIGCFCIAGGQRGWRQFLDAVRQAEAQTKNPAIYVDVQPRHFGQDNPLSSN